MRFFGKVYKDGKFWLAEIPLLDAMTQGHFLRRQRERSGLSLSEAAARLGDRSRNAYARYERGILMPSLEKLNELYRAVAPGKEIVLHQSEIA